MCSRHGSPALGEVEPGELRDAVTYTRAFLHVAGELEVIARGIRDTVTAKRGDVAGRGLLVYKLSQMYGEDADPQLPKLIAAMRRALGRGRRPSR